MLSTTYTPPSLTNLTAIVTGLPDESELDEKHLQKYGGYELFLRRAISSVLDALAPSSYAMFMQTDRKKDGHWIDKAAILTDQAHKQGCRTIFHKIILTRQPQSVNLFRPTYTHFLCFSQKGKSGKATPEVFFAGNSLYKNR